MKNKLNGENIVIETMEKMEKLKWIKIRKLCYHYISSWIFCLEMKNSWGSGFGVDYIEGYNQNNNEIKS